MHGLIMTMLSIAIGSAFLFSTLTYTSANIELKERLKYKSAYNQLIALHNEYKDYNNEPLSILTWEEDLSTYGLLPLLPPQSEITYNYNAGSDNYYFCITRANPDKVSHSAMSGLRNGFPRKYNESTEVYENTNSNGYFSSNFNVNTSCGATTDYENEPLESKVYTTTLASTIWIGGIESFYKNKSQLIETDFKNLKLAFDAFVEENNRAPTVDESEVVFKALRPYGSLPLKHKGFSWEYGLKDSSTPLLTPGSNYFCLKTIDTSAYSEQEREIHAESIYQLEGSFDNSYFIINRTSCEAAAQDRPTDYTSTINVYGSYFLN
jgi:hypothetical protein